MLICPFVYAVWFISFGQWDLAPLLETNETRADLDTYVEQLHYRFRKSQQEIMENENRTTGGWAMVVNMDGFTLAKAFDYTGKEMQLKAHIFAT